MNLEFKYAVVSTNVDGDKSTAKFTNAKSAFLWAKRLQEEEIKFEIYVKEESAIQFAPITITVADLKKEAGPIKATNNKRKRR